MSAAARNKAPVLDMLLIEDNLGDVELTREALKDCQAVSRLHVVPDGVEAMAFLRRERSYPNAPRPHLILLDLNLPRMDGYQVLKEVKSDSTLRQIPVIVLTTSASDEDVARAYDGHANCFLTKPAVLSEFERLVRLIDDFWCRTVRYGGGGRR